MAIKLVGIIKIVAILVVLIIAGLLSYNLYFSDWVETSRSRADINNGLSLGSVREEPQPGEVQILPTADPKWNLYRNFKYGFQIQYPAEWKYIKIFKSKDDSEINIGFGDMAVDSRIVFYLYRNQAIDYILEREKLDKYYKNYIQENLNSKNIYKINFKNPYLDYDSYTYFFELNNNVYGLGSDGSPLITWYIDRMIDTLEMF